MSESSEKCCKPKACKPENNKCYDKKKPFYDNPAFWKFLLCLNVLIILIRYSYIKCKEKDFSLGFFLFWLELQIILFFIVMFCFYYVSNAIIYLVVLFFYYLKALFSTRKTPKIMKFLHLKKTDEVLFRLYCLFGLFFTLFFILFISGVYIATFFFAFFYLLGYTKI